MSPSSSIWIINALVSLSLIQTAPQPAEPSIPESQPPERRRLSEDRDQRRERFERLRNATPEQRRQFQVDRWADRAARTYELDDEQKPIVRQEIENMQRERRAAMGPDAEEYDLLRGRMLQYWRPPADQTANDSGNRESRRERRRRMMEDPEFRKTRERLRELEQKYPVDWEDAMRRVEALLPDEQVQRGRERIEERQSRRDERRERRRERGEQSPRSQGESPKANPTTAAPDNRLSPTGVESAPPDVPPASPPAAPPHPWETYVRQFIAEHKLSAAQQAAATAILKDVRYRAGQLERSQRDKIAAAEKISDIDVRTKRLAELHQPVEQLFSELKERLDGLLTASQRTPAPVK